VPVQLGPASKSGSGLRACCAWRAWTGAYPTSAPYADARRRCGCNFPTAPVPPRWTCWSTAPESSSFGVGEWKRKKHGAEYRRQWRKVHLGIDAQTLEIRAIEVTDNSVGDAPMPPELLAQIPPDEAVASVSADGAYDTKACHAAIAQRGAQAGTPPRKSGKPWKAMLMGAGARARNEALKACRWLGYAIWKKWSGCHRRSLGDDQDALLQASGRTGHGAHV
jgi:hypothetical protein